MARDVKRKWKSLSLKVEHLRLELEDKEEEGQSLEELFREEISKFELEDVEVPPIFKGMDGPQINVKEADASADKELEQSGSVDESERPEEMKKLWKSIASATHPDKTGGDPEKTKLYKDASRAWSEGSYDELCRIAASLGLDLPESSDASLTALEKVAVDLEKKLKTLENSVLFEWAEATPEKKAAILDLYLKSKGKKRKI